jgi:hypothetical protein
VIGLYTSYAAPIFLRITYGRDKLSPGPFSLGRWATPVGAIAVAWVSFIVIMLFFPPGQKPTPQTMSRSHIILRTIRLLNNVIQDYSVVIILGVFIFASASWVLSARKWFIGPVRTIDDPPSKNH